MSWSHVRISSSLSLIFWASSCKEEIVISCFLIWSLQSMSMSQHYIFYLHCPEFQLLLLQPRTDIFDQHSESLKTQWHRKIANLQMDANVTVLRPLTRGLVLHCPRFVTGFNDSFASYQWLLAYLNNLWNMTYIWTMPCAIFFVDNYFQIEMTWLIRCPFQWQKNERRRNIYLQPIIRPTTRHRCLLRIGFK